MNTTAIAYIPNAGRSLEILVYAIAVVFTNVRELRLLDTGNKTTKKASTIYR